jgi:hypothetical protein
MLDTEQVSVRYRDVDMRPAHERTGRSASCEVRKVDLFARGEITVEERVVERLVILHLPRMPGEIRARFRDRHWKLAPHTGPVKTPKLFAVRRRTSASVDAKTYALRPLGAPPLSGELSDPSANPKRPFR